VICVPATLIVPVRAGPDRTSTEKPKAPLPLPDVAVVNVIHGTSLDADHEHPAGAWMLAEPEPPCAPND
jgi:hypothetical protein